MPTLKNPRHEAFAQALAKGETAETAYEQAGYQSNRGNATRMKANESISMRVAELVEEAAEKTGVTIERTLEELASVAFADLRNVFTPDGALLPPEEWDSKTAAAISSCEVVTRPTGERDAENRPIVEHVHKIKLWDKNSALEKLCKHLGMFVGKADQRPDQSRIVPQPVWIGTEEDEAHFIELAQKAKSIPLPKDTKWKQ